MSTFTRTDTSILGRWWWTVDRWNLTALIFLAALGGVLTLAASPAVAERIHLDTFFFARRQFLYLALGLSILFLVSMMSERGVRRLSVLVLVVSVGFMMATLVVGAEIKGATRWIRIGGLSLQPSEFAKPAFAVFSAWMIAAQRLDDRFPGYAAAMAAFVVVVGLLLLQPDVGMSVVVAAIASIQLFLAGLPILWVGLIGAVFIAGGVLAYFSFDHVQLRVDRFFAPEGGEGYQVARALEAFRNGGLAGQGPGEGHVKEVLPDAHADFILAVAGEEFGVLVCLLIVGLFAFIVLRGFSRVLQTTNLFVLLAVAGLLTQFALQAIINMASTLNLMPPKGMTLPFISYGGSSTLALGLAMGMMLALTREAPGGGAHDR